MAKFSNRSSTVESGSQLLDCRLVDLTGSLAVDDDRIIDLAGLDHRSGNLDAVEEAEAGVGDVEIEAGRWQPEQVWTVTALDGSSRCGTRWIRSKPMRARDSDDAIAFSPASAATSMNETPSGH